MKLSRFARRFLPVLLLMVLLVPLFAGCTGKQTDNLPEKSPNAVPKKDRPANEKPDKISPDSAYASVPIYDKFGAWPSKTGEEYYTSEVGTWFTVWWTAEGEKTFDFHWHQETRLKPVDYGYYSCGDADYLTSVFVRMKYIGIDFLLLDDTNGHWNDSNLIARNMYKCFRTADQLEGYAPQIAIATGGPLREGDHAGQQRELDEYYKQYCEKYPDVYYQYEGKPLVVFYVADAVNARFTDSQNRFTARYGTGFISWQQKASDQTIFKTQGNWGWVFDTQNGGTEILGVQPGYNRAHLGVDIQSFPREYGKRYIAMWLAAIKANPKVIMIPSYNDHSEETGWEATVPTEPPIASAAQDDPDADPYLYEKITEAYLALRYGYIEGFFYRDENGKQIYVCRDGVLRETTAEAAGKEPVILLPEGYRAWEQSRA